MLLEREDVNVNMKDFHGRTPLMFAVEHGYLDMAELLLTRNDLDVNAMDSEGRTAFSMAESKQYLAVGQKLRLATTAANESIVEKGLEEN